MYVHVIMSYSNASDILLKVQW